MRPLANDKTRCIPPPPEDLPECDAVEHHDSHPKHLCTRESKHTHPSDQSPTGICLISYSHDIEIHLYLVAIQQVRMRTLEGMCTQVSSTCIIPWSLTCMHPSVFNMCTKESHICTNPSVSNMYASKCLQRVCIRVSSTCMHPKCLSCVHTQESLACVCKCLSHVCIHVCTQVSLTCASFTTCVQITRVHTNGEGENSTRAHSTRAHT